MFLFATHMSLLFVVVVVAATNELVKLNGTHNMQSVPVCVCVCVFASVAAILSGALLQWQPVNNKTTCAAHKAPRGVLVILIKLD